MPGRSYAFMELVDTITFDNYLGAVLVDTEANGGEGEVIGGIVDLGAGCGRRMTVVPGSGEDTLWLWYGSVDDGAILSRPITQEGLGGPQIAMTGVQLTNMSWNNMKAARSNDRIAFTTGSSLTIHLARIMADGAHGYDLITLDQPGTQALDVEFSPNGRYLYAAAPWSGANHIWQYDLSEWQSDAVYASRAAVEADSMLLNMALQLGPDDRIYTWTGDLGTAALSVIRYPNEAGQTCYHELYAVPLLDSVDFGRPNLWWPRDWPTGLPETWSSPAIKLSVVPTPAVQQSVLRVPGGISPNAALSITAYAMSGQRTPLNAVRTEEGLVLHRGDLPAGVYGILVQVGTKLAYRATVVWADGPAE